MKTASPILAFTVLAAALSVVAAEIVVTESNAPSFYRDFTRLTKRPHRVAPLTATLCTIPSRAVVEREKQMTGLHYMASVHLYASPAAMTAVTNRMRVFPVGSVIVKEKLADDGKVSGVGGMVKRAAGFDAANGDWEYFYYARPSEFSTGRIRSCIDCHRAAKTNDYVYSVWSLPDH